MKTPRRWKWIRRFAAVLFIGAMTTLAVAWTSALAANPLHSVMTRYRQQLAFDTDAVTIDINGRTSRRRSVSLEITNALLHYGQPQLAEESSEASLPQTDVPHGTAPPWGGSGPADLIAYYTNPSNRDNDGFDHDETIQLTRSPVTIAHGWPWLAMECTIGRFESASDSQQSAAISPTVMIQHGLLLDHSPESTTDLEIRAIPLRPTWGFLLNTTLFSAIAASAWLLRTSFTHLHRYRRGLCPTCNYNRLSNYTTPCPECGHAATNAATPPFPFSPDRTKRFATLLRSRFTRSRSRLASSILLALLTTITVIFAAALLHARQPDPIHNSTFRDPTLAWLFPPTRPEFAEQPFRTWEFTTPGYRERTASEFTIDTDAPTQIEHAVGFPFTCLIYRDDNWEHPETSTNNPPPFLRLSRDNGALILTPSALRPNSSGIHFDAMIPLTPSLPGLLANLLLYTAFWYTALLLTSHLRTSIRRARHQCTSCGYPLNTLPSCPECGKA